MLCHYVFILNYNNQPHIIQMEEVSADHTEVFSKIANNFATQMIPKNIIPVHVHTEYVLACAFDFKRASFNSNLALQFTQGFLYKCQLFVDRGARQPHRPQGIMRFHKDPGANLLPLAAHMNFDKCSPLKGTIMRQIMKHTWDLHYMHSATIKKRRTCWRFKLKHSQENIYHTVHIYNEPRQCPLNVFAAGVQIPSGSTHSRCRKLVDGSNCMSARSSVR